MFRQGGTLDYTLSGLMHSIVYNFILTLAVVFTVLDGTSTYCYGDPSRQVEHQVIFVPLRHVLMYALLFVGLLEGCMDEAHSQEFLRRTPVQPGSQHHPDPIRMQ